MSGSEGNAGGHQRKQIGKSRLYQAVQISKALKLTIFQGNELELLSEMIMSSCLPKLLASVTGIVNKEEIK